MCKVASKRSHDHLADIQDIAENVPNDKSFLKFLFLKDFIYLFLERGEGWEKERERNITVWLPLQCPLLGTWPATQACALDWELNRQRFGSQAGTQSTEPHQPGTFVHFFIGSFVFLALVVYVLFIFWQLTPYQMYHW